MSDLCLNFLVKTRTKLVGFLLKFEKFSVEAVNFNNSIG